MAPMGTNIKRELFMDLLLVHDAVELFVFCPKIFSRFSFVHRNAQPNPPVGSVPMF